MVRAWSCMANTSYNWCQKKEAKLNFVTMYTFSDKSLQFSEKLTRFMGFLFFWDALYIIIIVVAVTQLLDIDADHHDCFSLLFVVAYERFSY